MAPSSSVARLTDIVEAIELIRDEMAGVTLAAFEHDRRKRWLVLRQHNRAGVVEQYSDPQAREIRKLYRINPVNGLDGSAPIRRGIRPAR